MANKIEHSRVLTLVFTDLADSTALKTERGDVVVGDLMTRHRDHVTRLAEDCSGRIIDWAGDGCFLVFDTPSAGVDFGLRLQRVHAQEPDLPRVRVGVHMGEVTDHNQGDGAERVEGLAVDLASRIESLAVPGQVLMSSTVFNSARQRLRGDENGAQIAWRAHGLYELKGFDDPLEICEAGFEEFSPLVAPKGSEKAHRSVTPAEEDMLGWRPAVGLTVPRREHWVLEEPLGEGGFGEVWLASHDKTRAKRVFKFCFESDRIKGLKREVVLFRLLRESLGHRDDIAQILEWEFDRAPYFIESEYTEGGDLKEWAAQQGGIKQVPMNTRLELIAQSAVALGAAHSVGVLHKDIKPANILISEVKERGVPRASLTDFGIGLLTDPQALLERGITAAGMTDTLVGGSSTSGSGTRLYMAPEVIEGKAPTTRSDIYALGVVLYQVATGDLSHAIAPGWERDIEDDLLREDIAACVDGNPEHRLTSAEELAERLRSLDKRHAEREAARKAQEEAEQTRKIAEQARRRRRQFLAISAVGFTLTVAVAVIAIREFQRAETQSALSAELEQANTEMARVNTELETALSAAEEARKQAEYEQYVSTIQLASAQLAQGQTRPARSSLLRTNPEFRNWEWGHLVDQAWAERGDANGVPKAPGPTTAETWKNAVPRIVHELPSTSGLVRSGTYTPDGQRIVTANFSGTARIWEAATGQLLTEIGNRGSYPVYNAVLFPRYQRLVTTASTADLWNSVTGQHLAELSPTPTELTTVLARSDDESLVAVSFADRSVQVFDVQTGDLVSTLDKVDGRTTSIVFTSNDEGIVTATSEGKVQFWTVPAGNLIRTVDAPQRGFTILNPDAQVAATASEDDIKIWDVSSGEPVSVIADRVFEDATRSGVSFSLDSTALLGTVNDGIRIWDVQSGTEIAALRSPLSSSFGPTFSPDGTEVTIGNMDGAARVWRPFPEAADSRRDEFGGHKDLVYQFAFSPDGERVALSSYDTTVSVWDLATGSKLRTLQGDSGPLSGIAYSGDGTRIAARGVNGEVRVWDAGTGEEIAVLTPDPEPFLSQIEGQGGLYGGPMLATSNIRRIIVSPDGKAFLAMDEQGVGVFDFGTGAKQAQFDLPGNLVAGAFNPDGRVAALSLSEDSRVSIVDTGTGRDVVALEGHNQTVLTLEFSADGSRLLTASLDGTARIWDMETYEEVFALTKHQGFLFSARYSPSGKQILTASADNTCKLWDAETGEELATMAGHSVFVKDAQFSPDGSRVMSYSADGTAKVWDLAGNELASLPGRGEVVYALWSRDGESIFLASGDRVVHRFSAVPWTELSSVGDDTTPFEERLSAWRAAHSSRVD